MNRFIRTTSTTAACALAFVPMLALATAVHAEGVRIQVGDLSQKADAVRFERQLDRAAAQICRGHVRAIEGAARTEACKAAVRDEASAKLAARQAA